MSQRARVGQRGLCVGLMTLLMFSSIGVSAQPVWFCHGKGPSEEFRVNLTFCLSDHRFVNCRDNKRVAEIRIVQIPKFGQNIERSFVVRDSHHLRVGGNDEYGAYLKKLSAGTTEVENWVEIEFMGPKRARLEVFMFDIFDISLASARCRRGFI